MSTDCGAKKAGLKNIRFLAIRVSVLQTAGADFFVHFSRTLYTATIEQVYA